MLHQLWQAALGLISSPRCPACGRSTDPYLPVCSDCQRRLGFVDGGLLGEEPLLWCALGVYAGELRRLLLRQRPVPQAAVIRALASQLHRFCAGALPPGCLLVPIPSWKRSANPLPQLLAAGLAEQAGPRVRLAPELLKRCRATVGQHHLDRRQRLDNQRGSFACGETVGQAPVWLVDDILTTGATALAAAATLQTAGWAVQGLLCLGRTPSAGPRRDLRCPGR